MSRSNLSFTLISTLVSVLVLQLCIKACNAQMTHVCPPSSCGNIRNISYPLRLKGDPQHCGFPLYELSCENNQTVLNLYSTKYYVQAIDYSDSSLRIVDAAISIDDCSSLPQFSMTGFNFSYEDPFDYKANRRSYDFNTLQKRNKVITFLKCANPVNSPVYLDTGVCIPENYSYVIDNFTSVADVVNSCRIDLMVLSAAVARVGNNVSVVDVHNDLAFGFHIWWKQINYSVCKGREYGWYSWTHCSGGFNILIFLIASSWAISMIIGALVVTKHILCTPCVLAFLAYTWSRRHVSMYDNIEEFLQSQNNLGPVRYPYSAIRKMTNGFKDKLGEGGYGSVYKGKLRSGRFAAVKILGKSKANGQDFINEVASIGQVHHINVVQLIGFCAEGSKRALVYDFMPHGSLDKYVLSQEKNIHLSWKKMHEVALGVARGIDYLHRGCKIQILHFDIKPHNILLDENFVPKVSDFGLAKLQATSDSNVTLTAARGTIGYIAPELFYKNIGGVSYKADVYSFGMLLMEMVGKKNNSNAEAEHSSQAYFPNWVYNELVDGKVELGNATEDEEMLAKKMITVALWCIQMNPGDRPSMNKVVKMLEEDLESLPLPSKPSLWPEQFVCENEEDGYIGDTWASSVPLPSSESTSLLANSY
ncbi:rust resistance kinase Lr10-like isoform X2 [Mercurialis annua]|uniref:rust resistance kinase Lr10-like isoform X2 n=1 Tax=Mercurialis annua TaxID=3986 RepID=UPI00215E250D|nr:rust resistance kinase Lr10-like isoform X2 [Mercurialis annua]